MTKHRNDYETEKALAEDRIALFDAELLGTVHIGPPRRDTTAESIVADRKLVADCDHILKVLDAQGS